jgi:hypothetical protein
VPERFRGAAVFGRFRGNAMPEDVRGNAIPENWGSETRRNLPDPNRRISLCYPFPCTKAVKELTERLIGANPMQTFSAGSTCGRGPSAQPKERGTVFGRRKKEKSFTDELEAQPVQPATPPGQAPSPPPEPPRVGDGNAVVVQGGTIEVPGGGGRIEFPQGATIIDARGVQGLRGEMLKAVEDMRAGKSAGPEELKAVIAKAMEVRNAYLAQAGTASPDGTFAGAPGAPAASTPPAAPAPEDPLDRLERLNNLRLAGTLTDAEFEEQKKKILGEM